MDSNFYKKLVQKSPIGYAYHKIICDNGNHCDYEFIEINEAFEEVIGIKRSNIIGRKASEVGLLKLYGEVALNGGNREIEYFSDAMQGWYKIMVSCPEEDHFVARLVGISKTESEEMYRNLIATMSQALGVLEMIYDDNGKIIDARYIDVNESYVKLSKHSYEELIGRTLLEVDPDRDKGWVEKYEQVVKTGKSFKYEKILEKSDPAEYVEVINYRPAPNQIAVILTDITERKTLEIALEEEKKLFETTLLSVGDGVISTDIHGRVMFINKVAEKLTGWVQKDAIGRNIEEVFNIINEISREKSENIVAKVIETREINTLSNHTILISKDGSELPIEDSAAPILKETQELIGVVLVFRDCTETNQQKEKIKSLSYHDQLTGLYNRRFYMDAIYLTNYNEYMPLCLVMADINGLKLVNDAFGHNVGDLLLKKVATILKNECKTEDIVTRIGGDEFVLLLPKTDSKNAGKIINCINKAVSSEKLNNITLSISMGFAIKQNINDDINEIFKRAEDEMYKHKLSESLSMRNETISLIINTLYEKSHREMLHSQRVSELCEMIATKMNFDKDDICKIKLAGLMHDIGKMGIDEHILNKPLKLNNEEWNEMKRHSEIGYRILDSVSSFSEIAKFVLSHHENWDGQGYPMGLRGEKIPLQSRIIAIADSFDAMTRDRSYRKTLNKNEAFDEIANCAGTQFDPDIAKVFIELVGSKHDKNK